MEYDASVKTSDWSGCPGSRDDEDAGRDGDDVGVEMVEEIVAPVTKELRLRSRCVVLADNLLCR